MATAMCEYSALCPVFNAALDDMPHTALRYREHYCMGAVNECARFKLARALGRNNVPATLLPNQDRTARTILMALR